LLHAAGELAGKAVLEALHVKQLQIALAAFVKNVRWNFAQSGGITQILENTQVEVEAEWLSEIAHLRAAVARFLFQNR
jgi:hypothetical protein